jgi:hypothetical protein
MLRIKTKNGEQNRELTKIDLQKEFEAFDKSALFDKKGAKYDSKRKWA